MNRRIYSLFLPGLLWLLPTAAHAQPATPAPADQSASAPRPLPRWDVSGFFGWRGARVEYRELYSNRWDSRLVYGGTAGYYLTANLKAELDVSATAPSTYDEYDVRPVEGAPYPLYVRRDHRIVTASLGGTLIYQFFENASFHPFLGAGAGLITIHDRISTARQTQVFSRGQNSPVEVVVFPEEPTRNRNEHDARGLLLAGFKAYPGERVFFRSDVQWSPGSGRHREVTWRLGVGVDF